MITPWLITPEGYSATVFVERTGFRSKDVSFRYHTAMCQNSVECKGHTETTFAEINTDFKHVSGEIWFLANVCYMLSGVYHDNKNNYKELYAFSTLI